MRKENLVAIIGLAVLLGGCCPWTRLSRQHIERLLRVKTNQEAYQRAAWEYEFSSPPNKAKQRPPARRGGHAWRAGIVRVVSSDQGGIEYFASDFPGCADYVIEVMFTYEADGLLGPIRVYLDPQSKEVVGYGLRM